MYAPQPIEMQPGVYREGTAYSAKNRWFDTQLVRFWKGKPERWRGWQTYTASSLGAPARGAVTWTTLDGLKLTAFGTYDKLWLMSAGTLYDITPVGLAPGIQTALQSTPWSGSTWGAGTWGGATPTATANGGNPRTWSLAVFGEDLIACPRGGTLYHWDRTLGLATRATAIPNAPATNLGVFVTPERYLVAYGAHDGVSDDPLRVAWADQETLSTWTPVATNTAGDIRLDDGNEIIAAVPISGGHLLITDISAFEFRYTGGQFVYGKKRVGGKNGCVGPNAATEVDGIAYWWGDDGYYSYDGAVKILNCDVHAYVFDDVNRLNSHKITCGANKRYGEVLWFYPDAASTENTRYVGMTKMDGWQIGTLGRSVWLDDNVVTRTPLAVDNAGQILLHEVGTTDEFGVELPYRLESTEIDVQAMMPAAGVANLSMRKFVPDFTMGRTTGTHTLTVECRQYPQNAPTLKGPYAYDGTTGAFAPRARAAAVRLLFEGQGDFRMGTPRMMMTKAGGRG